MSARVLARRVITVEHVGLVLSGTATIAFDDGRIIELHAGDLFYVPPVPHDSWVIGDEPYVSLHFLGTENYATESQGLCRSSSTLTALKPDVNQHAGPDTVIRDNYRDQSH